MAYSDDLRSRLILPVASGRSARPQAELFEVAASTAVTWAQARRAGGRVAARPAAGGRTSPIQAQADWFLARAAETPDVTVKELLAEFAERGAAGSQSAVSRFLVGRRLTFKKSLLAEEQTRADVAAASEAWRVAQPGLEPARLVFIDEIGCATSMVPVRGRAPHS